jgi:lysophospholipase L1-like esterase
MPTLRLNDAALSLTIPVGQALTVTAPPGSIASVADLVDFSPSGIVTGTTGIFGPYATPQTVRVACTAGAVSWDIGVAASKNVEYTIDPVTGGSIFSAPESTLKLPAGETDLSQQKLSFALSFGQKQIRPVMGAPPVVTLDVASPAGKQALESSNTALFEFDGFWVPHHEFGQYGYKVSGHVIAPGYPYNHDTRSSRLEFCTDSPVVTFEVAQNPAMQNPVINLWIDGQLTQSAQYNSPGNGAAHNVKIDFSGLSDPKAAKTIRIDSNNAAMQKVWIEPAATVWKSESKSAVRIGFLGDSITEGYHAGGVSSNAYQMGWWNTCADILGWKRAINYGKTTIGYINNGGSLKMIDRLQSIVSGQLDVLVCAAGVNDQSATHDQMKAAVLDFLAQAKALMPATRLIIVGPFTGPGQTASAASFTGIKAACEEAGQWYVDTKLPMAWQGSNSADYLSADSVHPNQAGHNYLAQRIANGIRGFL